MIKLKKLILCNYNKYFLNVLILTEIFFFFEKYAFLDVTNNDNLKKNNSFLKLLRILINHNYLYISRNTTYFLNICLRDTIKILNIISLKLVMGVFTNKQYIH